MASTSDRRRYAIVGTGGRAEMYTRALAADFPETAELVALCDVNQTRMDVHLGVLRDAGLPPVPTYSAKDFDRMLTEQRVNGLVVTTVDRFHDDYIVAGMRAGCDVVTEKPMTIDAARCRRILAAQAETGRRLTVTFNYRYSPVATKVREVLASGAIGEIGSVHFEWTLDTVHGADYFRRWHRDKANSGGLMVHKATHHFDLVNWWIDSAPERVFGLGKLFFYGDENGRRRGLARDYVRAHGNPQAADDPFAIRLEDNPKLQALYLDAEHEDGYFRDQNVFGAGITAEDDMAVTVRYRSGATMSYHLTAYSPWEGYRVMFNGSLGRLELEVTERAFAQSDAAPAPPEAGAVLHGAGPADESAGARLLLRPLWAEPSEIPLPAPEGGHGGGDARMLNDIFGADPEPDPLGRRSSHRDGALSLLTGLAANESFVTGLPVDVADLVDVH